MNALISVNINADINRVFDVFTDIPATADRIPEIENVEMLSHGPAAKGSRWRETRVMMGKAATEEMWITEFTPNRSYTVEAESCGAQFKSRFVFTSEDNGTRVDFFMETRAISFAAKLFTWLGLSALMRGMMSKAIRGDMEALKSFAES